MVIQCNMGAFSLGAWFFITTTPFLLNLEGIYTWKNIIITWFAGALTGTIVWSGSRLVWVYLFNLRYPVPLIGLWSITWAYTAEVSVISLSSFIASATLDLVKQSYKLFQSS